MEEVEDYLFKGEIYHVSPIDDIEEHDLECLDRSMSAQDNLRKRQHDSSP